MLSEKAKNQEAMLEEMEAREQELEQYMEEMGDLRNENEKYVNEMSLYRVKTRLTVFSLTPLFLRMENKFDTLETDLKNINELQNDTRAAKERLEDVLSAATIAVTQVQITDPPSV